jgi:hypothetical protein
MTEVECAECGGPVVQKPHVRPMKFCCRRCGYLYHKKHPATYRKPKDGVCDVCSEPFVRLKNNQRYCSRTCYVKAWPINNRKKHNKKSRTRRQEKSEWYRRNEPRYARTYRSNVTGIRPWEFLIKSARSRAKEKGFEYELDDEWASQRWTGCCEITGISFTTNPRKAGPHPWSATVDRIDSSIGYTKKNSRFILWACNALRGTGTDADMMRFAKAIAASAGNMDGSSDISVFLSLPA